jgi:hypothetical protein
MAFEADGSAVCAGGFCPVDRLGNAKGTTVMAVKIPDMPGRALVPKWLAGSQCAEYGVVKTFRLFDVI